MKKNLITVDESFYKEEEIDGFLVTEKMKRTWMSELEVLKRFELICNELGITYFASWGTLLGAIRHGGFVPWDDDIDIFMKRHDYNILARYAKEGNLPDGLKMIDDTLRDDYNNLTARFVNGYRFEINQEKLAMYHRCPFITGLDIDVLDKKATNPDEDDLQMMLIEKVLKLALYFQVYEKDTSNFVESFTSEEDILETIQAVESACNIKINRNENLFWQMHNLKTNLAQIYEDTDSDILQVVAIRVSKNLQLAQFRKEAFAYPVRVPFGPTTINVPVGYNEILKAMYGSDYLTPVNRAGAHDYPFYSKQDAALSEELEKLGITRESLGIV